jgi:hypothetical protein
MFTDVSLCRPEEDAARPSETSVNIYQTTRIHAREDSSLYISLLYNVDGTRHKELLVHNRRKGTNEKNTGTYVYKCVLYTHIRHLEQAGIKPEPYKWENRTV